MTDGGAGPGAAEAAGGSGTGGSGATEAPEGSSLSTSPGRHEPSLSELETRLERVERGRRRDRLWGSAVVLALAGGLAWTALARRDLVATGVEASRVDTESLDARTIRADEIQGRSVVVLDEEGTKRAALSSSEDWSGLLLYTKDGMVLSSLDIYRDQVRLRIGRRWQPGVEIEADPAMARVRVLDTWGTVLFEGPR